MTTQTASSRNTDRKRGTIEEAGFVGAAGAKMFCVRHSPAAGASTGLVICPSLDAELLSNYRAEVLLGRRLASRGVAVQRFHYRGSGHSHGDGSSLTFPSMVEDALSMKELFAQETGITRVAYFGARWGAMVAAAAAADEPDAPLALWEPALEGRRYFKEVTRFQSVHDLSEGRAPSPGGVKEDLASQGWFGALGYKIHEPLYTSGTDVRLADLLSDRSGEILMTQLDKRSELKPAYRKFVDLLDAEGVRPTVRLFPDEPVWWLLKPPMKGLDALVDLTARWIEAELEKA